MSPAASRNGAPRRASAEHVATALLGLCVLAGCGDDGGPGGPGLDLMDTDAGRMPDAGADGAAPPVEDARVVQPPPRDAGRDARVTPDADAPDPDEDADTPDCDDLDCGALSDECNVGVCDPETVTCLLEPRADGTYCGSSATVDCSARDTCEQGQCLDNDAPQGTPCDDQNVECHQNDTCDGDGQCVDSGFAPASTPCGDPSNDDCTDADTCDAQGVCQPNHAPTDSLCGDVSEFCRYDDRCNGLGACVDSGVWALGQCPMGDIDKDGQDYCLCGSTSEDICHPGPDVCIAGTCRLGHEQFAPNGVTTDGTACGNGVPVDLECDNPDACLDGECAQNGKMAGLPCGDQLVDTVCNARDRCDGFGTCDVAWAPMDTVCGDLPGECFLEPLCDGLGSCAAAAPAPSTTACGNPQDNVCTDPDTCNGAGDCDEHHEPSGTDCGQTGRLCIEDDECNGAGACVLGGAITPCP